MRDPSREEPDVFFLLWPLWWRRRTPEQRAEHDRLRRRDTLARALVPSRLWVFAAFWAAVVALPFDEYGPAPLATAVFCLAWVLFVAGLARSAPAHARARDYAQRRRY